MLCTCWKCMGKHDYSSCSLNLRKQTPRLLTVTPEHILVPGTKEPTPNQGTWLFETSAGIGPWGLGGSWNVSAMKAFMNILHDLSVFWSFWIWSGKTSSEIEAIRHQGPLSCPMCCLHCHCRDPLQVFICIDKVERTQGEVLPPTTWFQGPQIFCKWEML